jgi:threonine dehydrogenase-like Zn-dependent dehydrogenase
MKTYYVEAEWAPKPDYALSERELTEKRAMRGDLVWKNVKASLKEVPTPSPKNDEVLIKVGACGVCGSDLHALESDGEGYSSFASHTKFPVILGHEFSGEIVEVGVDVKSVRIGDVIAVEQMRWCGKCRSCRACMFNQCENLEEIGLSADGGFAEYAVVPEKYCCKINNIAELLGSKMAALEAGALAEPTCVAYSGMVINAGGMKPGSNVAIFGAGPIGLAALSLARAFGAGTIFVFEVNPARMELPKTIGADQVMDPNELSQQGSSPGQVVMDMTDGLGAGMIVEASGSYGEVYPEIIKCMGNGTKIVQLGMGATPVSFDMGLLIRRNARIVGSLGQAGNDIFPSVLRMMASGRIDMRQIITGRFPLDRVADALEATGNASLGHGKVLVGQHY